MITSRETFLVACITLGHCCQQYQQCLIKLCISEGILLSTLSKMYSVLS